jgi:hypothetical protein
VLGEIAELRLQVMEGELIVQLPQLALLIAICDELRLLKANALADGEAVLLAAPGNVITIFPSLGTDVDVWNWTVCIATIGTVIALLELSALAVFEVR